MRAAAEAALGVVGGELGAALLAKTCFGSCREAGPAAAEGDSLPSFGANRPCSREAVLVPQHGCGNDLPLLRSGGSECDRTA